MVKIKTLFVRDMGTFKVTPEVEPEAQWVIDGEGIATRKFDGICCKLESMKLYKRYDSKKGKTPPEGFIPCQDPDPITGHWPGWILVTEAKENKFFWEGFAALPEKVDGTYELCGPKIGTRGGVNPEKLSSHVLIKHGSEVYLDCPRTFEGLKAWFAGKNIEGVVFHHPDGRMVKIKKNDFYKRA